MTSMMTETFVSLDCETYLYLVCTTVLLQTEPGIFQGILNDQFHVVSDLFNGICLSENSVIW